MSRICRRSALLFVALLLGPAPADAQTRDAFVARLVELTNALGGAFGDEGADVTRAAQALEDSLRQWDDSIVRAERGFAADMPTARPATAAQMLAAIGNLYVQRGRTDEGIRQLRAALALAEPTSRATIVQLLAAAQGAAGGNAEAAQTLRSEWARGARDPVLAALLTETGMATAAETAAAVQAVVDSILQRDTPGPSAPFVTLALIENGAGEPVFPPARHAAAYASFLSGDLSAGVTALRETLARDPLVSEAASQPASMWRGITALRQGDLSSGIAELRDAASATPRSSEVHRALATAYWADGRLEEARAEFTAAIDLNPTDDRAYVALADVMRESGDDAQMAQTLARGSSTIPASGQLHWTLARIKERDHADDEAIAEYRLAARSGAALAGEGAIYAAIGRLQHARLDLDAATAAYEQRVRLEPNNAAAHQVLGDVLQARDLHERAVVEFLVAHLLNPQQPASLAAAAQSLLALGRDADAEHSARRAVQIDPENVQARFTLVAVLPRLGRAEEGRQQLEEYRRLQARVLAAQRRGMETNGFKLQAEVLSRAGDHAGAVAAWRQAMALEGATPETLTLLARELAAAAQGDAAVAAYRDALRQRPDVGTQRELLALFEKLGRTADAAAARDTYERMKRERLQQRGAVR